MVFGGTLVTYGTGTVVTTATGSNTQLGQISTLLERAAEHDTPMTQALRQISRVITTGIVLMAAAMLLVGTWREMQATGAGPLEAVKNTVTFAIALAVGAIPEGLPAIVTIGLATGVQRMAARRAVVRKLPAVETLGSTTVICSDKNGTLTRNEMTVQGVWTPDQTLAVGGVGYDAEGGFSNTKDAGAPLPIANLGTAREVIVAAALCNDASIDRSGPRAAPTGDPTEVALVVLAEKAGFSVTALRGARPRLDAIPFESEHQFMATLHAHGDFAVAYVKGAPEAVLARCAPTDGADPATVAAALDAFAGRGMRVLGVAAKALPAGHARLETQDVASGATFLGLVAMIDPPRAEAIDAIAACHRAGITVKMITGDHHGTAAAIGRQLGIVGAGAFARPGTVTGAQLATLSDEELPAIAGSANVFARVAPEHKLRLVRALQADGAVVAMTGDGVNDAPALKQSNIGVAMGITGTAVSKDAADIVLTDDNFVSIIAAVEEGRRVYDNLIKALAFVLPTNLGLALILMYAVAFFPFDPHTHKLLLPMSPTQLLWINLVGSVALALPLAFEAKEPDVMSRPPRSPKAPILSSFLIFRTAFAAVLMAAAAVVLFGREYDRELAAGFSSAGALAEAQTIAVTMVIAFQVFYLLSCRSLRDNLWRIGLFSNPTVFLGIGVLVALQGTFIYAPFLQRVFETAAVGADDIALAVAAGFTIMPIIAIEKWLRA